MRILMKVSVPMDTGNARIKDGSLPQVIQEILSEQQPEAAYFLEDDGLRTGYIVVNISEASEIPAIAEPWFLAFDARVELHPAMRLEDLAQAGPAIGRAVERFGSWRWRNTIAERNGTETNGMTGTTVDTAALARELYQAFNERRLDDVLALATEDIELTVVPFGWNFHGHEGFRDFMTGFLNGFSDVQIAAVTNQVASGDGVVTEFIARGTHDGPLASPAGEIPATGRTVEYPVVEVWTLRDGKVASLRNYFDSTTVLAQLGLLPE